MKLSDLSDTRVSGTSKHTKKTLNASHNKVICFMLASAIAGCSPPSPQRLDEFATNTQLLDVQRDVKQLQESLIEAETKIYMLQSEKEALTSATFDVSGERSYQKVEANVGTFLVVLEDIQPYLDGQRITLLIGNMNYATFDGVTLKVSWGLRSPLHRKSKSPEPWKAWKEYRDSKQSKEVKLTDKLRPGAWNKVRFNIAPAKAGEFGELDVRITTGLVSLAAGK